VTAPPDPQLGVSGVRRARQPDPWGRPGSEIGFDRDARIVMDALFQVRRKPLGANLNRNVD